MAKAIVTSVEGLLLAEVTQVGTVQVIMANYTEDTEEETRLTMYPNVDAFEAWAKDLLTQIARHKKGK